MQFRKIDGGYLVRIEKGEEVIKTITDFVRDQNIPAGFITGMGAITDATLGIYDTSEKEYVRKTFMGDLEVGNLTANISWLQDGEPFVHCHVTISDGTLNASTGHLFSAEVSVTLEIYIRAFSQRLERKEDPSMGFKFWQL